MINYKEREFELKNLKGFSEEQIEAHLKLYSGYVKNINLLYEKIKKYQEKPEDYTQEISELIRRIPFEWNGMRMHEYYFESLGGDGDPKGSIINAIEKQFNSFDKWLNEFKAIGSMRGTGWVVLYKDTETGDLINIWVSDHEIGHIAGSKVIIAMDVWEHAYLIDYLPSERGKYIEAFINNLNWGIIDERYSSS